MQIIKVITLQIFISLTKRDRKQENQMKTISLEMSHLWSANLATFLDIWILGTIMTACVHRKWINMKLSGTHLDIRKELPFGSWSLHIGSGVNARNLIFNNHLPTRINGFCAAFLTRWPITVRTTLKRWKHNLNPTRKLWDF